METCAHNIRILVSVDLSVNTSQTGKVTTSVKRKNNQQWVKADVVMVYVLIEAQPL